MNFELTLQEALQKQASLLTLREIVWQYKHRGGTQQDAYITLGFWHQKSEKGDGCIFGVWNRRKKRPRSGITRCPPYKTVQSDDETASTA